MPVKDILQYEILRREKLYHELVKEANSCLGQETIYFSFGDAIDSTWLHDPKQKILMVEGTLDKCYTAVNHFVFIPVSMYSIYLLSPRQWHRDIDRTLSCLMHRIDPLRQFYFYKLAEKDFHRSGAISFHCWDLDSQTYNPAIFDKINREYYHPFSDKIYQVLRSHLPFQNFTETGDTVDQILRSKVHLVIETYPDRPDNLCITEKTFKALQTPRPWLVAGATGTIEFLRELGFYVFDDFVDHTYNQTDSSQNHAYMQDMILQEIDRIIDYNPTQELFDHWERQTRLNVDRLIKWESVRSGEMADALSAAFQQAQTLSDN